MSKIAATIPLPSDSSTKWTVYGEDNSKFCLSAKNVLENFNETYTYHNVNHYGGKKVIVDTLKQHSPITTNNALPIIYSGTSFIGGYTNLQEYLSSL